MGLSLWKKRDPTRLLILSPMVSEIPSAFEEPTVVAADPQGDPIDVRLQLDVDGSRPEGRYELHSVQEALLGVPVVARSPLDGAVEIEAEVVHDHGDNVVLVVSCRPLPVIRRDVLQPTSGRRQ